MKRHAEFARRITRRYRRTAAPARAVPLTTRRLGLTRVGITRLVDGRLSLTAWTGRPLVRFHDARRTLVAPATRLPAEPGAGGGARAGRVFTTVDHRHPGPRPSPATHTHGRFLVQTSSARFAAAASTMRRTVDVQPRNHARRVAPVTVREIPTSVRRAGAAALRQAGDAPPPTRPGWPGWELPGRPPRPPAPTGQLPAHPVPVDVARLTDQVVAAIDQRLIAHRERSGRSWP